MCYKSDVAFVHYYFVRMSVCTVVLCSVYFSNPPLMMAQSWAESTKEITNYGRFIIIIIIQFPPNIIRSIRQFERINKKYVDKKCLLSSIKYMYMCVCVYVCPGDL